MEAVEPSVIKGAELKKHAPPKILKEWIHYSEIREHFFRLGNTKSDLQGH